MIGIISDIHANYVALAAVMNALDDLGVSTTICLGDIAGYHDQINECCDELRSREIFSLMGNHDWYLTSGNVCSRSNSVNRCIEYQRGVIQASNLSWLASLSSSATIHGLNIVHGGWHDQFEEYMTPSAEYFADIHGSAFASGHTHEQLLWSNDSTQYCNPGSVGQPRDGDPRSAFATWDGQRFTLHRVEYDITATQQSMALAGFDPYYSQNLSFGLRLGAPP